MIEKKLITFAGNRGSGRGSEAIQHRNLVEKKKEKGTQWQREREVEREMEKEKEREKNEMKTRIETGSIVGLGQRR